jgi:type II secretory pathway component PulF
MRVSSGALSRWYVQLAASLEAGLSLSRSLRVMGGVPEARRVGLAQRLDAGEPVPEALEHGAAWLPVLDRQLIGAAAAVGRLPEVLRRLSERHADVHRATWQSLAFSAYPLLVTHVAVLAFPINTLVNGPGLAAYARDVLSLLIPLWVLLGIGGWAVRRRLRVVSWVMDGVPLLRGFRRHRALSDLAFVLEAQVAAGVRYDIAWLQAGIAARDARLERIAMAAAAAVQQGQPVGPVLTERRDLATPFAEFYHSGEQTGRLAEHLGYLQKHFRDQAMGRLRAAVLVYPNILFLAIAIWVAWFVIGFYSGYFHRFDDILSG